MGLGRWWSTGKPAPGVRASLLHVVRWWALVGGVAGAVPLHAQLLDSLAFFSQAPPRFVAKLDTRGSFISNSNVRVWGVKVGLEHAGRLQYGLGWSMLASEVQRLRTVDGQGGVPVRLRLGYLAPYVEYAFYARGPWEARIPVQLGVGQGSLAYTGVDGRQRTLVRSFLLVYEPAMTIQYRFLKYFGAHAGWGFRLMLVRTELDETLTAPVYLLGLKVFMGDLWRDLRR
ncbi:MAG: hypothetical protein KBH07_03850 [Flavobacteriales bacterium]|nr:hypothetical protein [Flavobacteriales bacterium]MBP9079038.1 hypothetical protein [Flavobacteriales bacterium]